MKRFVALVLFVSWFCNGPVNAADKNFASPVTFLIPVFWATHDLIPLGITGLTTSDVTVTVTCGSGSPAQINWTGDTWTERGSGWYWVSTNDAGSPTAETECLFVVEGNGSYGPINGQAQIATAPRLVKAIAAVIGDVSGTVVSSADCTNTASTFDTTLGSVFSATDGPIYSALLFTSGALNKQQRQITGFNVNGCVTTRAFTGAPAASDAFILINK